MLNQEYFFDDANIVIIQDRINNNSIKEKRIFNSAIKQVSETCIMFNIQASCIILPSGKRTLFWELGEEGYVVNFIMDNPATKCYNTYIQSIEYFPSFLTT